MRAPSKYEPFDNFVVTESVRLLPEFDLPQLIKAITDIIESEKGAWHSDAAAPTSLDLFGACLAVAFDGDELVYDLGASAPSSPFGILTVMLASEWLANGQ